MITKLKLAIGAVVGGLSLLITVPHSKGSDYDNNPWTCWAGMTNLTACPEGSLYPNSGQVSAKKSFGAASAGTFYGSIRSVDRHCLFSVTTYYCDRPPTVTAYDVTWSIGEAYLSCTN
jgi:hypothetical protein